MKVGDFVWVNGKKTEIIGETRVSWKLAPELAHLKPLVFPKKPSNPQMIVTSERHHGFGGCRVFLTKREWLESEWIRKHRHAIARVVEGSDFSILLECAKLVEYPSLPDWEGQE